MPPPALVSDRVLPQSQRPSPASRFVASATSCALAFGVDLPSLTKPAVRQSSAEGVKSTSDKGFVRSEILKAVPSFLCLSMHW